MNEFNGVVTFIANGLLGEDIIDYFVGNDGFSATCKIIIKVTE